MTAGDERVRQNASAHDRIASAYDASHREIFNEIEQARLRASLATAAAAIAPRSTDQLRALDFGCGTGNVTRHLLELGLHVTASDISAKSLELLAGRYAPLGPLATKLLSDAALAAEAPDQFDLVTTYSVLHHIPDYLQCVANLFRVLRPGGVLYIDHEASPEYWAPSPALIELRSITAERVSTFRKALDPQRTLNLTWWYRKIRRAIDRRYTAEGDIHVWPDDHIEWDRIVERLRAAGAESVLIRDYLVFREQYTYDVHATYRERCADMRVLVMKKPLTTSADDVAGTRGVASQRA